MTWSRPALATLAAILVVGVYVVGYFAVIERRASSVYSTGGEAIYYRPRARMGGEAAVWLYCPLIELDRRLRPGRWEPESRQYLSVR
jgi:hypothetical protein